MMLRIIIFIVLTGLGQDISAQQFNTAFGSRFGNDLGISVAQRIGKKTTLQLHHEIGLFSDYSNTSLYAVQHLPIIGKRFNIFIGGGIFSRYVPSSNDEPSQYLGGPAATMGLDATFGRLNIAADWSPQILVGKTSERRFQTSSAITIRYVIVKRKSKFKSWRQKTYDRLFKRGKKD